MLVHAVRKAFGSCEEALAYTCPNKKNKNSRSDGSMREARIKTLLSWIYTKIIYIHIFNYYLSLRHVLQFQRPYDPSIVLLRHHRSSVLWPLYRPPSRSQV